MERITPGGTRAPCNNQASMRVLPLSETAVLVEGLPGNAPIRFRPDAAACARDGLVDASSAFGATALYFLDAVPHRDRILQIVEELAAAGESPKTHRIRVCYELGDDLAEVCQNLGLSIREFVATHAGAEYLCEAIGFTPGFPYLTGLPEKLAGLPRRSTPRPAVPAGSVAIAESMCGIYPATGPGGWHLIGRTNFSLFDPSDLRSTIAAGDRVAFEPVQEADLLRASADGP